MMNFQASGAFEVTMQPESTPNVVDGVNLGRLALNKQFAGDLVATGKGEMLTALTSVDGSAGYVAIERVTGTLHDRQGSFVFQHNGLMERGTQQLAIVVVPDSGTGQLTGIAGVFTLKMVEGKHTYTFDYSLPD